MLSDLSKDNIPRKKLITVDTISIIVAISSKEYQKRIETVLRNINIENDYKLEIYYVYKKGNTAAAYNEILSKIKSEYKLYIREDVVEISRDCITHLLRMRATYGEAFALGFLGSYLTIDGDFVKKNKLYGSYRYIQNGNIVATNALGSVYRKNVHVLDSAILFTDVKLMWNETVGEHFYMAAYCSELRKANITPFVLEDSVRFEPIMDRPNDFELCENEEIYNQELYEFNQQYRDLLRPLVSIGIPTYNSPKYFKIALDSALAQTYDNIEIIVGDDSTNDETKKIIQPYLLKYNNLKYINNGGPLGRRGGMNSRNILNWCNGEYIQLLFHDDIIYPKKIATMVELFAKDIEGNIGFIASGRNLIDKDGKVFIPYCTNDNFYETVKGKSFGKGFFSCYMNYIGEHSAVLIRKECLMLSNGKLDIGRYWGIKDWNIGDISTWLNICRKKDFVYIHEALSEFRLTLLESQNSNDEEMNIEAKFEYFLMTAMAWLNTEYIYNENEFKKACINWQRIIYPGIEVKDYDKISENVKLKIDFMVACDKLIDQNKIDVILDLLIRYLLNNKDNDVDLHLYCEYDGINDKWMKRIR